MADLSAVDIANMALSNIGASSVIESFDENSPAAKQCKLWYNIARKQTLEVFDFSFARKRVDLALSTEAAPSDGEWAYRFLYPSDCLAARKIANPVSYDSDDIPFVVEMDAEGAVKTILCNVYTPTLIYTFDQEDTALFSLHFCQAVAALLAHHIAYSLTKKRDLKAEQYNEWRLLLSAAEGANALESRTLPARDAEAVRARA